MSIFVILQIFLFILMKTVAYSFFAYICVITACLFCILLADKSQPYLFTKIGLITTVIADFFLVLLPVQLRVPGMIFFCGTQFAYFLRIYSEDNHRIRKICHLILRIVISVLSVILAYVVLESRLDILSLLSVFYFANLILNLIFSFLHLKKQKTLAIAFSFFILSDTLIGFDNLSSYLLIQRGSVIYFIVRNCGGWVMPLYLIAQTLIALSLLARNKKAIKEKQTNI